MITLQFSPREKTIFIILIVLCIIYGVFTGFYRPTIEKFESVEEEIARSRRKLTDQTRLIERATDVMEKFQTEFSAYRQTTSHEKVISTMLTEIEKAGTGSNVKITKMKPSETQKQESLNTFGIDLSMEGKLGKIMWFIHTLQTEPHNFLVPEFKIEMSPNNPDDVLVNMVLNRILIEN